MTARNHTSMTPFVLLTGAVLATFCWLGWHLYQRPQDPDEAVVKATEITRLIVEGTGGDDTACGALPTSVQATDATATVQRCEALVASYRQLDIGPAVASDLRSTGYDLHHSDGTVTVAVNVQAQGLSVPMHFTWPMRRSGGHWWVAGPPHVTRD